ncbi:MAG: XTP/dITP diphosphohydrolase [Oleiphilaceae bacterium]
MKVVLASGNKGKLKEFSELLAPYDLEIIPQSEFKVEPPEETGLTFIENAIIKARYASQISGLPAIADDSGLAIDALNGQPGIYSARFSEKEMGENLSDQTNIDLALKKLAALSSTIKESAAIDRTARFHCVLVFMAHAEDPTPIVCHGQWQGSITLNQSGVGGFGYDPVFWVPEFECTAAELTKEQKNSRSHRGQALKQLIAQMDLLLESTNV